MKVTIGSFVVNDANVVTGLDNTMTVKFAKGEHTLAEIDAAFVGAPKITLEENGSVTAVYFNKSVQAYRVEGNNVEVSFKVSVESDNTIALLQSQIAQLQNQLAQIRGTENVDN